VKDAKNRISPSRHSDTTLILATGEQRIYANILLTIGVVKP
jgi:L-fucose mutarotase/ribose pyranase (RbsD/FucU family)